MTIFSSQLSLSSKQYASIINNINFLENNIKTLTENEIKEKILKLRKFDTTNINNTEVISEVFALTRETAFRNLGLRHFDNQLLGGLVLNEGKIAEMKTGEGKTLVATLAASLNALSNKGVHLVTVNDYLAKRDKEWMQSIYQSLGFTVGLIQKEMNQKQRQLNYSCDITYVTNSELGFDFLRDGTAKTSNELVLRPFNFCIIDEVDSILIDEARTPLILSTSIKNSNDKYKIAKYIVQFLILNIHYEQNTKTKNITLTDKGFNLVQTLLGINDLYNIEDPWISYITNALRANIFYKKNQNYLVIDNKIAIVDEFSGRIMPDRRWSEGLHQAIETKEDIIVGSDLKTVASITYQSFFSLYPKISGMTGTAKTAEEEFKTIYNLEVSVIPTKNPIQRQDYPDIVFLNKTAKWNAVVNECIKMYKLERPILVGTSSVEESEFLSEILTQLNIKHQVLNAKPENIKRESEIIAQAGRKKSITIATNMAGRGTDIILGGNVKYLVIQKIRNILKLLLYKNQIKKSYIFFDYEIFNLLKHIKKELNIYEVTNINNFIDKMASYHNVKVTNKLQYFIKKLYDLLYVYYKNLCSKEAKQIKILGGLYVLGTDRNESRRVDNQLRGRSGRQGDPGTSCFFLSLEDNLFLIFGGNQIKNLLNMFNFDKDTPIKEKSITNSLDKIQEKIETYYYNIRKNLLKYDEILTFYRNFVLYQRRQILLSKNLKTLILLFNVALINGSLSDFLWYNSKIRRKMWKFYKYQFQDFFTIPLNLEIENIKELKEFLFEQFFIIYDLKSIEIENKFPGLFNQIQKESILKIIDFYWNDFLEKTSLLGEVIGWQNYAQKDPLLEYKRECSLLFDKFLSNVRKSIVYKIIEIQVL
jgi:preprotein translocase subunit SecA